MRTGKGRLNWQDPREVGARAAELVARSLAKTRGRRAAQSSESGAADLKADFGDRKWYVQVKASGVGTPVWPSTEELRRLKISAGLAGATPVVALVDEHDSDHLPVWS